MYSLLSRRLFTDLALTSSGDGTAHLWRAVVSLPSNLELINKCQSSGEEELDGSEDDNLYDRLG